MAAEAPLRAAEEPDPAPVFANGRVFVAMGQSPGHGNGPSLIHANSPNGQGDVTASRLLWTSREVGRMVGTPIEKDGLLYVGDVGGTIHCLDAATGAHVWKHETMGAIWGCLLLAGDRLYVGNEDGTMTVLRAGRAPGLEPDPSPTNGSVRLAGSRP
jgi:outer membrane protein assembly factor BamB